MSEIIKAWVTNPSSNLFSKQTDPAMRTNITCDDPGACSLLQDCKGCILTSVRSSCRFGKKTSITGPTRRAGSFHAWIRDETAACDAIQKSHGVRSRTASNRILLIRGWYYLPYPHMTKGAIGPKGAPLASTWIAQEDMTAELLERICRAEPRSFVGDVIRRYQETHVPKFLQDLAAFHPDLFALLPQDQKDRTASLSFVGRKADLETIAPGPVEIGNRSWYWDGAQLTGTTSYDLSLKGEWEIKVTPAPGTEIKISRDDQVLPGTIILD